MRDSTVLTVHEVGEMRTRMWPLGPNCISSRCPAKVHFVLQKWSEKMKFNNVFWPCSLSQFLLSFHIHPRLLQTLQISMWIAHRWRVHRGEPITVILLNGHNIRIPIKYIPIYLYMYISAPSDLSIKLFVQQILLKAEINIWLKHEE